MRSVIYVSVNADLSIADSSIADSSIARCFDAILFRISFGGIRSDWFCREFGPAIAERHNLHQQQSRAFQLLQKSGNQRQISYRRRQVAHSDRDGDRQCDRQRDREKLLPTTGRSFSLVSCECGWTMSIVQPQRERASEFAFIQTDGQTDRQTERNTYRQRDTKRETQTGTQIHRQT